ncbi:Taf5 protein [Candida orthopsilosis Co 90-125]|uniref:Taf5 protein n=1 Tax=Candida orthopsilosis (strain 90-125) TaxID=1136231 RepID=H8X6D3_CANO9|nr:Taf5 protein [Candida orthopsilosis Co 90-125]CCG23381.1 Taf5 protein [Candida orthopsilosis Co 90-125]
MNNEAKRMSSDAQQNATGAPIANTQSSSQSVPLQSQAPRPAQQQQQQQVRSNQPQYSQADLNRIVLDYLNKKGYHRTESMLRLESTNTPTPAGAPATPATTELVSPSELVVNMEDKLNKDAKELRELKEKQSKVERELQETKDREVRLAKEADLRQLKALEAKTRIENDPDTYFMAYSMLRKWVESSLDLYKPELSRVLYPLFIHCFLDLITKGYEVKAKQFFDKYKSDHLILHGVEVRKFAGLSLPEHIQENEVAVAYRKHRYRILVSKTSLNLLLYFLHENEAVGGAILIRMINQYLDPVISKNRPDKIDQEGEANPEEGISEYFANTNELEKFNSEKEVKLGKMPLDTEVSKEVEAELKVKDGKVSPVNGKTLSEEFQELTKPDVDSPAKDSLPLPMKDATDIKKMILQVEDSRSKIKLGTIQASSPSVCMYTFHNTNNEMTCVAFNEDSTLVAAGFQGSYVRIWSLDGKPLESAVKKDRKNHQFPENSRKLIGHSGPIYGISFSPDNKFLLTCSEDKTVRLWSLDTFTALVSYKGHNQPVWDVKFSPLGHYFATASHDQTARLWATDHIYPLRIFAGHINDVDCVEFHPNSNYVFTGSSDRTCRMWDVHNGHCVRIFMGHTNAINCLAVSPNGRWLASAGEDNVINLWDIGTGRRLKTMKGHGRSSIYSLSFSRDGTVLVSGSGDNSVRVWDVKKNTNDAGPEPEAFVTVNNSEGSEEKKGPQQQQQQLNRRDVIASSDHMTAFFTKKTPVFNVHFTRRNLCLAAGPFQG